MGGGGSPSWNDLKTAIEKANDGDTVYLNGSTYTAEENSQTINITRNITIHGGSSDDFNQIATVNAKGITRIITTNASIILINLNLINGLNKTNTSASAGAIYSTGNSLTIINCSFVNNSAISNSTISKTGVRGGAIYYFNGNLTIINSSFINNVVHSYSNSSSKIQNIIQGYAIYGFGNLIIINCIFVNNRPISYSYAWGGAIDWWGNSTISNSTFCNGSTIDINEGDSLSFVGCSFVNNPYGAIYIASSSFYFNLSFVGCCFVNNSVNSSFYDDIVLIEYYGDSSYFNLSFVGCCFVNNSINHTGSVVSIYIDNNVLSITLSFVGCSFVNNSGHAIYFTLNNGNPSMSINLTFVGCCFVNNVAKGSGGAVYIYIGYWLEEITWHISFMGCCFVNNVAMISGGAVYIYGHYTDYEECYKVASFSFVDCCFVGNSLYSNTSHSRGGAVYFEIEKENFAGCDAGYQNFSVSFINCCFVNNSINSSVNYGGAIYIYIQDPWGEYAGYMEFNISFVGCCFVGNSVLSHRVNNRGGSSYGGAIYIDNWADYSDKYFGLNLSFIDCYFINNSVNAVIKDGGGAIYINSWDNARFRCNLIRCSFVNNSASNGASILVNDVVLTIHNSSFINTISDCTSQLSVNKNSVLKLYNNTFKNCIPYSISKNTIINSPTFVFGNLSKVKENISFSIRFTDDNNNTIGSFDNLTVKFDNITTNAIFNNKTDHFNGIFLAKSVSNFTYNKFTNLTVKINFTLFTFTISGVENFTYGESINTTINISTELTGFINISYGNITKSITLSNKSSYVEEISGLVPSNYNLIILYSGDEYYDSEVIKTNFTVNKAESILDLEVATDEYKVNITANLNTGGEVNFYINETLYAVKTENQIAKLQLYNLAEGNYAVKAVFKGDDYYLPSENSTSFNIHKNIIITANPIVMYRGNGSRLLVSVSNYEGKPIENYNLSITVNGVTYNKTTDEYGIATLGLSGLQPDIYTINIGSRCGNYSINTTVEVLSTIVLNDLTKMYKNGSQLYATLVDGNGKPIGGVEASFNINGVFYKRISDVDGTIGLNINLRPGTYIATVYNEFTGQNRSATVMVISSIASNNLTKYYKNDSHYFATILNGIGNPVQEGLKVVFNIHGVFYNRTTDENGIIMLNINLAPGEYIITIMYGDLNQTNVVTVLSPMKSDNLTISITDRKPFKIYVLDNQGNPTNNTNVIFNINGVFYNKTTNEDGIASLNINLMAGTYIITSILDNGYMQSNTITVKD